MKLKQKYMYKFFFKRLCDVLIVSVGLIVLSPIFIILLILLLFTNQGKPFFIQRRPGKNEKIFKLIKFKTMNDRKGKDGELLPDSDRLTRLGKFIRKTSLDEIPQLYNVLKGEMSLIGPRPLRVHYLTLYDDIQKKRHNVKPGITGWAQVNGRNSISWSDKFKLDIYYVNNISFMLDIKIFFLTIRKVILRDGITKPGQVTTEAFKGGN